MINFVEGCAVQGFESWYFGILELWNLGIMESLNYLCA